MNTFDIEKLNGQSKGFQILSVLIGIWFAWAGINITWTLAKEYGDVTFGSLMLAAPLFTVGLLGFLCFWFARMTSGTNAALLEILKELRSHQLGRPLDGTWTCYAHNKAYCPTCREIENKTGDKAQQ